MISIITPTIRPDGLAMIRNALKKQTFTDFEWVVGSPFEPKEYSEEGIKCDWVKDDFTGGFWTFNRVLNRLFDRAQGELVVSWQDWIHVGSEGLEKFWNDYQETNGEALITGVGDQYAKLDDRGKPSIKIWNDPRKNNIYGSFYECTFPDMEWNWGAIPKKLFDKAGGIDEKLDFMGYDGATTQLDDRLNDMGVKFFIDQDNESYTVRHGREDHGGQFHWDENHSMFNGAYSKRKKELIDNDEWPVLKNFGR